MFIPPSKASVATPPPASPPLGRLMAIPSAAAPLAAPPVEWVAPAKPVPSAPPIAVKPIETTPINTLDPLFSYDGGVVEPISVMKSIPPSPVLQPALPPSVPAPVTPLAPIPPVAPVVVEGTDSKDFLLGTAASDVLYGYGANDFIMALEGDDVAFGGLGNDVIFGGGGNDILYGDEGEDSLEGGLGDDLLFGGAGNDTLYGGAGLNILTGGEGSDTFRIGALAGDELLEYAELGPVADGFSVVTDFDATTGDVLNFSLVLLREAFAGLTSPDQLAAYLSFQQLEAGTQVLITTPQGVTTVEALLLNVEATSLTPDRLEFTPPMGPAVV